MTRGEEAGRPTGLAKGPKNFVDAYLRPLIDLIVAVVES